MEEKENLETEIYAYPSTALQSCDNQEYGIAKTPEGA